MDYKLRLIQAHHLRECVGKGNNNFWYRLLPIIENCNVSGCACGNLSYNAPGPVGINLVTQSVHRYHLPSGSLIFEKTRGQRIADQPWEEKTRDWKPFQQAGLYDVLTRKIGLGDRISRILVNRPRVHFLRIEEFINGLVDALWLTDERLFVANTPWQRMLRNLIRKIFRIGTFNLPDLVQQWKVWSTSIYLKTAKMRTIGEKETPLPSNIFARYLGPIPWIVELESGRVDMLLLQHLSHLVSSRQFPYMGKATEVKAYEQYRKVLTSAFDVDPIFESEMGLAAARIGGICKSVRPGPILDGEIHVSVTTSGELDHSIMELGQAAAVREALIRRLTVVPEESFFEETPFGPARHLAGFPLFNTLFRDYNDDCFEALPDGSILTYPQFTLYDPGLPFLAEVKSGCPEGRGPYYNGLGVLTGKHLLYVAWKESTNLPVLRAEVVPEMGNKARFVTLSPYWLNVLQAPLAHLLVEAVRWHPSCFSSFQRQDQAWQAANALAKLGDISLDGDAFVLSSDLKDATNAQQFGLTKTIIRNFMRGYGLAVSPYVEYVLGLIGPRIVLFKDGSSVVTTTGIMMGEAIAKPSLTLLNLAVEELAFMKFTNADLKSHKKAPIVNWRCFHIGGDDHLAIGPLPYLDLITDNHRQAGSHITPGQHGCSKICVKYCERILYIENLQYRKPIHENYELSLIVDSVKVRLLERGQSTMIKKDNKNVAIGKSGQLAGALKWLPKDNRFWTYDKKVSIRNLFVNRMGPLLPSKVLHPKCYQAVLLPTNVGGFGLGFDEELPIAIAGCPAPFRWMLNKHLAGQSIKEELKLLRMLNSNRSVRGLSGFPEREELIAEQTRQDVEGRGSITWKELMQRFPSDDNRKSIALARKAGIISIDEYAQRKARGNLFQALIMGNRRVEVFNTSPYARTYNHIWTRFEELGTDHYGESVQELTVKETRDLLWTLSVPNLYMSMDQKTFEDIPYGIGDEIIGHVAVTTTYGSMEYTGLPDMIIGKEFIGVSDETAPRWWRRELPIPIFFTD